LFTLKPRLQNRLKETMSALADADLLSTYYAVASIIVIYQMFLPQSWTTRVDENRASLEKAKKFAPGDLPRVEAKSTAKSLAQEFPLVSSLMILIVIIVLVSSGVFVSTAVVANPFLLTLPAFSLAGASIFSLIYTHWKWRRLLNGYIKDL
jgi:hypothetical protein